MKFLRQSWLIASKDLSIFARDRFAVAMALVFPILFVLLFSLLFPNTNAADKPIELVVATEEPAGGISHQIISGLTQSQDAGIRAMSYNDALEAAKSKNISGFLGFPADFSEGLATGSGATLKIVVNADAVNTSMALAGLASSIAGQANSNQVAVRSAVALMEKQMLAGGGDAAGWSRIQQVVTQLSTPQGQGSGQQVAFNVEKAGPANQPPSGNWLVPGYLVMFVFFASAVSAEGIVAEKETQTLERLMAGGTRRSSMLGGKFLFSLLRGTAQVIILWAVGVLAFDVDMGLAPAAVVAISFLTVVMASAFGVMLATVVKTRRAAGAAATTTSIALAPIGGCWWPLFITPLWMQFMSKATPHAWATTGFNKLLIFGASFTDVLPEMLALLAFAVAFGAIALVRFRPVAA